MNGTHNYSGYYEPAEWKDHHSGNGGHKERETKKAAPSVDARTLSKRYAKAVAM
jgi:hypothetical protein